MPKFDTPAPISVTVQLGVGDVRIVASDRHDTIVEVRPSDESKKSDVTAARQTRVEYASGRLLIKAPKGWRQYSPVGGDESIDVQIEVPQGSQVRGEAGVAAFHGAGRLGECHFKTGIGEIQIEHADGPVELQTGVGDVTVNRAAGHADVSTSSGAIRVGTVDGTVVIKNSNGDTWIGEVTGDLRVRAANGRIIVDQAGADVVAKTANGDIRLGQVSAGAIVAETALGKVDVGIRDGVAAWLDLNTRFGNVHSDLDAAEQPRAGDNSVEVRARSAFGDITIRHAPSAKTAG